MYSSSPGNSPEPFSHSSSCLDLEFPASTADDSTNGCAIGSHLFLQIYSPSSPELCFSHEVSKSWSSSLAAGCLAQLMANDVSELCPPVLCYVHCFVSLFVECFSDSDFSKRGASVFIFISQRSLIMWLFAIPVVPSLIQLSLTKLNAKRNI